MTPLHVRISRTLRACRPVRLLFLPIAISGCAGDAVPGPPVSPPPPTTLSAVARAYLTTVLDTMETHSIRRKEIDWPTFRLATLEVAGAAQTTRDTYDAIRDALGRLGDGHSFFVEPGASASIDPTVTAAQSTSTAAPPTGHLVTGQVGYVNMPTFSSLGQPQSAALEHAQQYHNLLSSLDGSGVCGWIVDLRSNLGGNMWPMLAGIGPVLGEGTVGFFVDPDGVSAGWRYEDGEAGIVGGPPIAWVTSEYELLGAGPPVAVLTDHDTTSSGEAIVTAFRERPDTRSFGGSTRGLSTANRGFTLSDGALLLLTVSTFADRTGRLYGDVIVPDALVFGEETGDPATDAALAAGLGWLQAHAACAS